MGEGMSDETVVVHYRGHMVSASERERLAREDAALGTKIGDMKRALADLEKQHNAVRVAERLGSLGRSWQWPDGFCDTFEDWQIIALLKDWQEMHAALSNIARNGDTAAQHVIDKLECKP
jgi:hypothetical protein